MARILKKVTVTTRDRLSLFSIVLLLCPTLLASGAEGEKAKGQKTAFPCPENEIAHYAAYHIGHPLKMDGRLDESAWQDAPFSPRWETRIPKLETRNKFKFPKSQKFLKMNIPPRLRFRSF